MLGPSGVGGVAENFAEGKDAEGLGWLGLLEGARYCMKGSCCRFGTGLGEVLSGY